MKPLPLAGRLEGPADAEVSALIMHPNNMNVAVGCVHGDVLG